MIIECPSWIGLHGENKETAGHPEGALRLHLENPIEWLRATEGSELQQPKADGGSTVISGSVSPRRELLYRLR